MSRQSDSNRRPADYKSAALNQLSYAGNNTAHINGRCRVKQVAESRCPCQVGSENGTIPCVKAVLQSLSLTISAKPVGVGTASQPLILRGERSSLLTRITTAQAFHCACG